MKKIAILGSENSHCMLFASTFAPKDGKKLFEDIELLGVYGDPNEPGVAEGNEGVAKNSACKVFADDKDAFLEEADAIMVTARNGSNHLKYARNYIKKGIPVWMDKPVTGSVSEVMELLELADKHGAIISGGSSLEYTPTVKKFAQIAQEKKGEIIGGHVTAQISMVNPYGNFWFYAQHLVSMVVTVFGMDVKSVCAIKTETGVHAIYKYDGFEVSAFFGTGFSVSLYTSSHELISEAFDLTSDFYMPEVESFYNVMKTGKPDKTKKEYITPIYVIEATVKAYESGKEIAIEIPKI